MIPIKQKIKNNFSKASISYDSVAYIQKETSKILVLKLREFFPNFFPKTILDLGTGTGFLPQELMLYFDKSHYTLNDIAPGMIDFVRKKFKDNPLFSFCLGDFEEINFSFYDLIISNLAFQWAESLKKTLRVLFNKANVFAFSSLLKGSFIEWNRLLMKYNLSTAILKYPSQEVISQKIKMLRPKETYFYQSNFQLCFSNAYEFMMYLKLLGASSVQKNISPLVIKKIIKEQKKEIKITYKVLFSLLRR